MVQQADALIVHGHLFTMAGQGVGYIEDGALAVRGTRIAAVGGTDNISSQFAAPLTIDASGKAVLPGLVDSHTHSSESLLRGVAQDVPEYMGNALVPFSRVLTGDLQLAGTRLHVLEALKAGTTTIMDFQSPVPGWAEFYSQVGLRARLTPRINSLADNAMADPSGNLYAMDQEKGDESIESAVAFARAWHGAQDGRITVMLGPQAPDMVTTDQLVRVRSYAEQLGSMIHMHVAQGDRETNQVLQRYGMRSIPYLDSIDCIDEQLFAVHLTEATDAEVDLLVKRGSSMGLCSACIALVDGIVPPARRFHEEGGCVGLGTDAASSNNSISIFNEMRLTALFNKIASKNPRAMPAWDVLRMATIEGACAIGLGDSIGSLEVGKEADVILVNLNELNLSPIVLAPIRNIVPNLVYAATGHEVDTVIVAGRILMQERQVLPVSEDLIRAEAQAAADELHRAVLQDHTHGSLALVQAMKRGLL
jgi:5-methylthioadenosine/S-adenosylhomocysteine deaminase